MSSSEAWRIADNLGLAWQDWDEDEVVVFSRGLGHSFLLSAASARLLGFLADEFPHPLSRSELADRLLPCCAPGTAPTEVETLLDLALPEFYRIGLAHPLGAALVNPS